MPTSITFKMTILASLGLALLVFSTACTNNQPEAPVAQLSKSGEKPAYKANGTPLHNAFDVLLKKHVSKGIVSYKGLKTDEKSLDLYLADLNNTNPDTLSPNQALAFWINAYNAFTLKLILNHYPGIKSIKDIPDRWDKAEWSAGGQVYSLNDIEHNILRKKFTEPRIHFAIVCASISCPDLRAEAFKADKLDEQLTDSTKNFIKNPDKGLRTEIGKSFTGKQTQILYLSKIMKWFSEDFERKGDRIDFVTPYLRPEDKDFVEKYNDKLDLKYLDYDWALNGD